MTYLYLYTYYFLSTIHSKGWLAWYVVVDDESVLCHLSVHHFLAFSCSPLCYNSFAWLKIKSIMNNVM